MTGTNLGPYTSAHTFAGVEDKNDQGTVTALNWAGVVLRSDNRSEQTILHNDMAMVVAIR